MKFIKKIYNLIFLIILVPFILLQFLVNLLYSLLIAIIAVSSFIIWLLNFPMSQKVLEIIKFNTLMHVKQKSELEFQEREWKIKEMNNSDDAISKEIKEFIDKMKKR